MILLRLISWPYARKHLLRSVLTTAGVTLGVAVFVGMHTANRSVVASFYRTVDRVAGATQLQVSAGETGFEEDVLERVQSVAEVRTAVPVIEATVSASLKSKSNLLILAVDMAGDRSLRDYDLEESQEEAIEDPLVFLAQPDSLMLTREFAAENGLALNDKVTLDTAGGPRQFTVRGIMKSGGLASAFGGNLAVMDVYAAQKIFGRGRRFDRIDLAVKQGVPVDVVRAKLGRLLGPGFQVDYPSTRGKQFESLSSVYATVASITSLYALFIGLFLIYNSFSIAVTQRRAEIGILRALGATRGEIRTLFLTEGAVGGLAGSAAGVFLGLLIARGIADTIGRTLELFYGISQKPDQVSLEPWLLGVALAAGLATSIAAAYIPARNAARVDPVQALQKGKYQVLSAGENRLRRGVAAVLAACSAVFLLFPQNRVLFYLSYLLAVLAAILLAPALAMLLTRLLRPLLKRLRPVEGTLAADSLLQAPRRTSATAGALMLSLALVISLAGMAQASYRSMDDWISAGLDPDLFVSTSENVANRSYLFPPQIAEEIRKVPGVRKLQEIRIARVLFRGSPIMLVAGDVAGLEQVVRTKATAGDLREMYRLTAAGKGVMVSDNLANIERLRLGEMIEIPTPRGVLRLPIAGINIDYTDQRGSILLDREVYRRWWGDDASNMLRIYVAQGTSPLEVRRTILERFGGVSKLFVFTNRELRDYIMRIADTWFGMTYIQIAVAVLVAVLGIVNTLTVSITDRRRELGVLQAVGGLRKQIRHTVWLEALAIGFAGLIMGLALGALILYFNLQTSQHDLSGFRLDYEFPVRMALTLLPVILGAAFIAALGPAESAVRCSLVEALEYE